MPPPPYRAGGTAHTGAAARRRGVPGSPGRCLSVSDRYSCPAPAAPSYWPSDREAVRFGHLRLSPQSLEAPTRCAGVVDGVPGVAMAEVVLDEAEVVALVSQREAARLAQRVRMHPRQASTFGRRGDQVVDRLRGERLAAFGDEQPGQRVGAGGERTLDGAQLVAGNRLLDGQPALEPA